MSLPAVHAPAHGPRAFRPAAVLAAVALLLGGRGGLRAQSEHGFVNTRPSGQPYLSPEESLARLHVPPGFEVRVFAAEPDVINPIAFTFDERGRLWVVECFEYPKRTPKGQKPRDRIKILEDTTGTGRADKVTVWAQGKDLPVGWDLATGIEVGHGGVFLGAAPYLFFLRDTTGAGRCDRQEVLLSGFGSEDTHETLNTFQWGPDGRLYGLHGIFTQSQVGGVRLNAAVWRYRPADRRFDVFADGTSNPWGLDFDRHGQAFLTACVIPHAFHIIPGGTYIRQDGRPEGLLHPYAFGQLREISDHLHHQESGWAHAGALVLDGPHVPPEYRGSLLMGSIHGCSIKRDRLERRGSTFVARHAPDFLTSGDRNFRPINLRWGPDGAIYVIDWHDQNPCHQADPDSWDLTHGRIYKIQPKGTPARPPGDLAGRTTAALVALLKDENPWWHRTALRLLAERGDRSAVASLEKLVFDESDDAVNLRGLWALDALGAFDEVLARRTLAHRSAWVRSWTVRLLGESGPISDAMLARLSDAAAREPSADVRLQLACTGGQLAGRGVRPLLSALVGHREDVDDPCIPLMTWLALEPLVAARPRQALDWARDHAADFPLVAEFLVPRTVRRLAATGRAEDLAAAAVFVADLPGSRSRRIALEGLLQALQGRAVAPPAGWEAAAGRLRADPDAEVGRLARRLAVAFGDPAALRAALAAAADPRSQPAQRIDALHDLAPAHPTSALGPLLGLVAADAPLEVRCEACRALGGYEDDAVPRALLAGWRAYPAPLRNEAVRLLAGRKTWAARLLAAVGRGEVPRTDLTDQTVLRIRAFRDRGLDEQVEKAWGRTRDTPAELQALIRRMRAFLARGPGSFDRGRRVFEAQCARCHRFEGVGHEVGPHLDGAARDVDDLLVNVLDPNRVVGRPYYTYLVTLKSGRLESGILADEDGPSITLKNENDALKRIDRKDVEEIVVEPKSLMPEGLQKNMTPEEFRDLVRYLVSNPFLTEVTVEGPSPAGPPRYPSVGLDGAISLPPSPGGGPAVVSVTADVVAPSALATRLLVGTGGRLEVSLNGRPVYSGRPAGAAGPDQAGADVVLRPGTNRLTFRVTYRGERERLFARLLDPKRELRYPPVRATK